jgi:predicted dehydrogenase
VLQFDNGACGCLEALWVNPGGVVSTLDARLEVVGTQGRLLLRVGHEDLEISDQQRTWALDVTYWPTVAGSVGGALRAELAHFARCVREDREPLVSLEDALRAVAVAEAIERSLAGGCPADVGSAT